MKSNEVQELSSGLAPEFLHQGCIVPLWSERSEEAASFWIGWGISEASETHSPDCLSVYAPDFFLKATHPWRLYRNWRAVRLPELKNAIRNGIRATPVDEPRNAIVWRGPKRDDFQTMFGDLQTCLRSGELKKAVPVVFAEAGARLGAVEKAGALLQALETAERLPVHVYGFWNANEGMLGATPELLFHRRDAEVSTMALAGTRPHTATERMPLLKDPKELDEHRFVLDGITSALGAWGQVNLGETCELRLQKFSHLYTPLTVQLALPKTFEEIAHALHPTPALGAWPREAGMRWLEELQRFGDRARFGAPFGAVAAGAVASGPVASGNEGGVCWVSIRGLQWFADGRLLLGAGCGVTAQSELEREWNELAIKLESAQAALGL